MPQTYCFAKFEGEKQGVFKGESKQPDMGDFVEVLSVHQGSMRHFSANSRVSGPITPGDFAFNKAAGAATVNFIQALTTRELLKEVSFDFWRPKGAAKEIWLTVKLKNAFVTAHSLAQAAEDVIAESISLNFESIEWDNKADKMQYTQRWAKQK